MTESPRPARSLAVDVGRMVAVVALLTVLLGIGLHGAAGDIASDVPAAEFGYHHDAAAGTLTITHVGGDAIAADAVDVVGPSRRCADGEWQSGRIGRADTCVLDGVDGEVAVRVVWHGEDRTRVVLDVWTPPEA